MPRHVPNDLWYDRSIRGQMPTGPQRYLGGWIEGAHLGGDEFYRGSAGSSAGSLGRLLARIAGHPYAFGGVLLLLGVTAVFLRQAPFLYQLVLGAPIFEEAAKFGLALLLAYPLRYAALRLPVAWAVGAGFGWVEHQITYPGEGWVDFLERILFHGGATLLSMACYQVLEGIPDVRGRWASTLPATFIHYVNNSLALLLTPTVLASTSTQMGLGGAMAVTLTGATYLMAVVVLSARPWFRSAVAHCLRAA